MEQELPSEPRVPPHEFCMVQAGWDTVSIPAVLVVLLSACAPLTLVAVGQ